MTVDTSTPSKEKAEPSEIASTEKSKRGPKKKL